jgi:regulator of sirC expression with transglutaminase-like and TPR domain
MRLVFAFICLALTLVAPLQATANGVEKSSARSPNKNSAALTVKSNATPIRATETLAQSVQNMQLIQDILEKAEADIDLARAKLVIDNMVDPSIDVEGTVKRLDLMAQQVRKYLPPNATPMQKMAILRDYIYKPGPWNENRVFSYDLNDPLGKNIRNKLLPTYLTTRRGNCVSMPLLFIILGQKIGIDLTASTAPAHIFVKFRDDNGEYQNFEATSGGLIRDSGLRESYPMSEEALTNRVYLAPLSKKETVVEMAALLLENYASVGEPERRINLADTLLKYHPNNAVLMIHKRSAFINIMKRDFIDAYPSLAMIPPEKRQWYARVGKAINLWYDMAYALGWREPTEEQEARYSQTIERAKSAQRIGEKNGGK